MDPWMKLNFTKHPQIRIWAFLNVFRVSKCRLILRFGTIQSKVVHSQISLIVTKHFDTLNTLVNVQVRISGCFENLSFSHGFIVEHFNQERDNFVTINDI